MFNLITYLGYGNPLADALRERQSYLGTSGVKPSVSGADVVCVGAAADGSAGSMTAMLLKGNAQPTDAAWESFLPETERGFWWAEMYVSECRDSEDEFRILVMDSCNRPIPEGTLSLFGKQLTIVDGMTSCPVKQLKQLKKGLGIYLTSEKNGSVHDEGRPSWRQLTDVESSFPESKLKDR